MKRAGIALAIATLLVFGSASLSAQAQTPILQSGNYISASYVTSVTQVTGSGCSFSADQQFFAQIEFAGAGQSVTFVATNPNDSSGVPISYLLYLPQAPTGGSDSTTWTGNYTKVTLPGGSVLGPFPFSGTLQSTGKLTFVGTMTLTDLPYGNGSASCDVSMQFSSAFSGPLTDRPF